MPSNARISRRLRLTRARPLAAAAALLALLPGQALSQSYPSRPIKMIVPYTPGTGPDAVARVLSRELAERLGQPLVVENRPGASGNIGADAVAKAAPDGYTVMLGASTMLTAALLYRPVPFDPVADFTPISLVTSGTLMLAAGPKNSFASVAELVAAAKAAPGRIAYSSPGVGTPHHMIMELFQKETGIKLLHVPYKGTSGAVSELMGGQVDVSFLGVSVGMPAVKSGRLRALAVGSPKRYAKSPDVPTLEEAGVKGAGGDMWFAVLGPKGMPEPIVTRLNTELRAVLLQPAVKNMLDGQGLDVLTSSPQALHELMVQDTQRWADVIRVNKIVVE